MWKYLLFMLVFFLEEIFEKMKTKYKQQKEKHEQKQHMSKRRNAEFEMMENEKILHENANKEKTVRRQKANFATKNRLNTLVCVIEHPQTVINVCAIIRTANALGVAKVYIVDHNHIMPKTWEEMRNDRQLMSLSVSAIKWIYVKTFETTTQCFEHLRKNNFVSVATSPHNKGDRASVELDKATFTDKKLAIWFGNECSGITCEVIEKSTRCVKIDMFGMIESLNLATCAGIILHEIAKQRRAFRA